MCGPQNFDVSFATHGAAQGLPFLMTSQNNHCLVSLVKLTMSQVSDLCLHQLNHHVNPGGHNIDLPPLPMDPSVMIFPEAVPYNHLIQIGQFEGLRIYTLTSSLALKNQLIPCSQPTSSCAISMFNALAERFPNLDAQNLRTYMVARGMSSPHPSS